MSATALPILKGADFADHLRAIVPTGPAERPWDDLRYRRILVPALVGGETMVAMTGMVAVALARRGAEVTVLGCDAFLPACSLRKADHIESACTRWCHRQAAAFLPALGLETRWIGEIIDGASRRAIAERAATVTLESIDELEHAGVRLGEHVARAMESHFKIGRVDPDDAAQRAAVPGFAEAALLMAEAVDRLLAGGAIDKVMTADGRKILWGVPRSVAHARGIPVHVVSSGPRGRTIRLELRAPGAPRRMLPAWSQWRNEPLTSDEEAVLDTYMAQRATRPYEHRSLGADTCRAGDSDVRAACGLDAGDARPVFSMFPNLSYDSGTTSTNPLFGTAGEWTCATVDWFGRHAGALLVVKANPNERHRAALDPLVDRLAAQFPALPENVRVLPPETTIPAQDLVRVSDVALVYTSTVAAEAVYLETPVVLVGGGAHAGRGVTHDARDEAHFFTLLEAMCTEPPRPAAPREIARRYAYAVFFRNMLPAHYYSALDGDVTALDLVREDFDPGGCPTLDLAARAVLLGAPVDGRGLWQAGATSR